MCMFPVFAYLIACHVVLHPDLNRYIHYSQCIMIDLNQSSPYARSERSDHLERSHASCHLKNNSLGLRLLNVIRSPRGIIRIKQ